MTRRVVEGVDPSALDDLARVHDRAEIAELSHDRQVMRDQDQRQAEIAAESVEQLQDLRLHHHVERRRRLVRDQHFGITRESHRNRGALTHATRELVREAVGALGRDPDGLQQLRRLAACGRALAAVVELDRLDDLRADRSYRIERVHRALEDDCKVDPAVRPDRLLAPREYVLAVEQDPPRRARVRRQQAHCRQRGRRLAAARLADKPEPLAGVDGQRDALDGVQLAAVLEIEPDMEILDLEQAHSASFPRPTSGRNRNERAERCATRSRGFNASSSAPPIREHARMISATSAPGGTIAHQAPVEIAALWNAFSITLPSEIRDGSPSPRNANAVSSKIATAIVNTVLAIRSGATWGSTWRATMRRCEAPSDRARFT